jgi:hypothetical protein
MPATSRALSPVIVHDVLPGMQRRLLARAVADRDGATFLARFDVPTRPGQANAARVRSVACRSAWVWHDALYHLGAFAPAR